MLITGWMYMLECSDGTFYTGSTNNLTLRLHQHQVGEGANYTKKRLPVKLVYSEEFERIDDAFYREKQVQGWTRKKKEALMRGDTELLKELSKSRAALLNSVMASEASPLSAMASTASASSATAIATADKTATSSRIPSFGESKAVAIAVAELAEAVEATNLLGNDTADKTATSSRIPSSGEIMAVAIAVAELAEAVEATNLLGDAAEGSVSASSPLSAVASTGSATADKTATNLLGDDTAEGDAMASEASPLSDMASTGSATAENKANTSTTKHIHP